jgi:hypothetical protein
LVYLASIEKVMGALEIDIVLEQKQGSGDVASA